MGDCIETKEVRVFIQANGIIRNTKGRFLARLDDEIDFDGEHLIEEHPVEEKMYSKEEVIQLLMKAISFGESIPPIDTERQAKYWRKKTNKWIEENL